MKKSELVLVIAIVAGAMGVFVGRVLLPTKTAPRGATSPTASSSPNVRYGALTVSFNWHTFWCRGDPQATATIAQACVVASPTGAQCTRRGSTQADTYRLEAEPFGGGTLASPFPRGKQVSVTAAADGDYSIRFLVPILTTTSYRWVLTDPQAGMSWDLGVRSGTLKALLDTWCGSV